MSFGLELRNHVGVVYALSADPPISLTTEYLDLGDAIRFLGIVRFINDNSEALIEEGF